MAHITYLHELFLRSIEKCEVECVVCIGAYVILLRETKNMWGLSRQGCTSCVGEKIFLFGFRKFWLIEHLFKFLLLNIKYLRMIAFIC